MNIPKKYQIFPDKVIIFVWQEAELAPHLASWESLNKFLRGSLLSEFTLRRLIVMEMMGKSRWKLIDRLLMRLSKVQRKETRVRVKQVLQTQLSR